MCAKRQWKPPTGGDPQVVLEEANADTSSGRFEPALRKYLWFHNNALEHSESLAGVRLSYAVMGWLELAAEYPPALDAFKAERKKAKEKVLKGEDVRNSFLDFSTFSRYLGREKEVVETFKNLASEDPAAARDVYPTAQDSLVLCGEYEVCESFLEPQETSERILQQWRGLVSLPNMEEFANQFLRHGLGTLVALLVANSRQDEAKSVVDRAAAVEETGDIESALASALEGKVPKPWPEIPVFKE